VTARPGRLSLPGARVVALGPLTEAEAGELVGDAAARVYGAAGGNPFYLEQLARVGGDVAVAAAVEAELAALAPAARALLEGAAVAGDPFDLDLAAAVAERDEPLEALDALLAAALVRPTDAPRRFAFRHPIVRHAVYTGIPGGRRLGAHARAAAALRARGAGAVELAHHVEHAGDAGAAQVLTEAADALRATAPATAARFYAAALRLDPGAGLHWRLADAQAAAGDPAASRDTLLATLDTAADDERLSLTVAVANAEWALGRNEQARRRLQVALAEQPAAPSPDRIRLRLALTITALAACELEAAEGHASDALADARAVGDPVFEAAARSSGALAIAHQARTQEAERALAESAALLERLTAAELATRLPALWMHARARRLLGHPRAALADLERGAELAARTGREIQLVAIGVETALALIDLGRLPEALDAAADARERARLSGHPGRLAWAGCAEAAARLALGQPDLQLIDDSDPGLAGAGLPGWVRGATLTALGRPAEGAEAIRAALPRLLPADRPRANADLAEALGEWRDVAGALRAAGPQAPMPAARARLAEGRALAAAGERAAALAALTEAEAAFSRFGALRRRDEATRELRRLGRRVVRPAQAGEGPLTAREQEIAGLVAAGRTNREIADQLVLSPRTIDAHLRTIYAKLGVRSRVELAREVAR
jgi:DNA-binding CsgD family transcriptional regulator